MNLLDMARAAARPSQDYLQASFGTEHLSVVYAVQRNTAGPVKIGTTTTLARCAIALYAGSPDPVIFAAVLPGGQPLRYYLHHRYAEWAMFGEWYEPSLEALADVRALAAHQRVVFAEGGHTITEATVEALRRHSPEFVDWERLHENRMAYADVARLTGLSRQAVRDRYAHMRALGFPLLLQHRAVRPSPSPRHVRFAPDHGTTRLLG